ncbi:MAG: hypothetical protein HKP41_11310 [Desulfobacterales bacterium]|nr:hypothetical protein [Deltaproteobacteria bacterium]NNK94928.1 hypothetical protein [Desulfobacterales bacterium]
MKLIKCSIFLVNIPLTEPYHLSFSEVDSFNTIITVVRSEDDEIGVGESTALPGYSSETLEDMWNFTLQWGKKVPGSEIEDVIKQIKPYCETLPFCVTSLLTSLEMIKYSSNYQIPETGLSFYLLGAINSLNMENIKEEVEILIAKGFKTLKLKVGWDIEKDIARTRYVQEVVSGRANLRIDANQGFSFEDAQKYVLGISKNSVELFEQPFGIDKWEEMSDLQKISPLPLMLDESIHTIDDIERTFKTGCAEYVKFKLMKAGSLERLRELINQALINGLKVVVGNGVAGEIGCVQEAMISQNIINNAGEMNGFARQKENIFNDDILLKNGCMSVPSNYFFNLNYDRMEKYVKDKKHWN